MSLQIIRGVALGLALMMYGREEGAEALIEAMTRDQDPILRRAALPLPLAGAARRPRFVGKRQPPIVLARPLHCPLLHRMPHASCGFDRLLQYCQPCHIPRLTLALSELAGWCFLCVRPGLPAAML